MINIALFGAGRIGYVHALAVSRVEGIRITSVSDVSAESANRIAGEFDAKVRTIDEALADKDIHAVIIATPTDSHAELIEKSARAGKAIFCEKPLALNRERAEACVKVIEETGVLCAMGFQRRYDPHFAKLKAQLDAGKIGKVEMVSLTSRDPGAPPVSYIKTSGGLFLDMTIHDFDMARWLLGEEPTKVSAHGANLVDPAIGAADDIDSAYVTLQTPSGKMCVISNCRRASYGYDQRIEVLGEKGMLQANNQTETNVVFSGSESVAAEVPLNFFLERYAEAYRLELEDFAKCLREGGQPRATHHDGMMALLLGEAAWRSYRSGKTETVETLAQAKAA